MRFFALLLVSFAVTSIVSPSAEAHCQGEYRDWNLGFGLGQGFPDRPSEFSQAVEKDWHGSLWLRRNLCPHGGIELNYNHLSYTQNGDPQTDLFSLNLFHRFGHRSLAPVLALGAGLATVDRYAQYSNQFGALARFGVEYALIQDLMLGLNAQYTYVGSNGAKSASEQHTWSYLIGLSFNFGAKKGTAAGTAPAQLPPTALPNVQVLIPDSDGDGVNDENDKCPGTPAGKKVNGYGCQEKEVAKVEVNILFSSGKAEIDPSTKDQVEKLASFMKEYANTTVVIEGHTDNVGKPEVNMSLSQARANALKTMLVKEFGIDAKRLSAKGFGSTKPVADNKTPEGREQNRRVMANISN